MVTVGSGKGSFLNIQNQLNNEIPEQKDFYLKIGYFENSKQWENALARIKINSAAPVGEEHRISMPMTAEPLANAFRTPVFYFSTTGSQGFFPHFTPANNNPPIFIAFIPESSHFVALTLKDPLNFPFPYPVGLNIWRKNADCKALDWEQKYSSCIILGQDK
ncbi:uncharacterized protein PGTG_19360 [Puccinia graminis f. sp. tritici CRL 75-36-700-3]|uniref:Uncharacterized protein n=1 Tax=Puccinia graminis f. sp. tritici (strain CRL 75-36-700-3 / race SCCL) TaxID=418459 RepID=E3L955_PUCGT|nr:uncharacterized protein PGTG_19360 [Puccinia graminis f. sp. tritici CRL 75-36-700-3]EFP93080.1 hypothetical protein PGTG_19360 [Puccinia graminis f. sp. tritici CRL 75-36-700-3]